LGERWLYGGDVKADQNSAKAAGHELKGLEVLLKESEGKIQVPLMMSIDHQGNLSFPFLFFFFQSISLLLFPLIENSIFFFFSFPSFFF
jgi:hypothetical protein